MERELSNEQAKLGIKLGAMLSQLYWEVQEENSQMEPPFIWAYVGTHLIGVCVQHPEWAVGYLKAIDYPVDDEQTRGAMDEFVAALPLRGEL